MKEDKTSPQARLDRETFRKVSLIAAKRNQTTKHVATELVEQGIHSQANLVQIKRELSMSLKDLLKLCDEEEIRNGLQRQDTAKTRTVEISEEELNFRD